MFHSFFLNKRWWLWSIGGTLLILLATRYKVKLDVQITNWFGTFYDSVQNILKNPNSVTFPEFLAQVMQFAKIAGIYIVVAVLVDFFGRHYIFRWRTAMTEYYLKHWEKVRHIEGLHNVCKKTPCVLLELWKLWV